jgi:hippurate hydrolase
MRYSTPLGLLFLFFWTQAVQPQDYPHPLSPEDLHSLENLYQNLHAFPELSHHEEKTSRLLAGELRSYGYEVAENIGQYSSGPWKSYGIVAVLKNGTGPTLLVRTDMDALPVEEKTSLPFASRIKMANDQGLEVSVMHACGHDLHMTVFLGTAKALSRQKENWKGTLVLVGQPAEETGDGAKALLNDGLYTRFPRPDFALALHDTPLLEAGKVGYRAGNALAGATSIDLVVRGIGGHGSRPEGAKDPIVAAAQIVLALQTIVSRENSPLEPAVVSVGSIHGGTKHNIIPEEVRLQLTVRTYNEQVRQAILHSIERIAKNIALALGIPPDRAPEMKVAEMGVLLPTYNDPPLTRRLVNSMGSTLGNNRVLEFPPVMGSEDFGEFGLPGRKIPICLIWLGTADASGLAQSKETGIPLPYIHSPLYAPVVRPSLETGILAMTAAVRELLPSKP